MKLALQIRRFGCGSALGERWAADSRDAQDPCSHMAADSESEGKLMEVYCGNTWKLGQFPALSASGSQGHEVTVFSCACHSAPSLISSQIATGEQRSAGEALMFYLPGGEGPASQPGSG